MCLVLCSSSDSSVYFLCVSVIGMLFRCILWCVRLMCRCLLLKCGRVLLLDIVCECSSVCMWVISFWVLNGLVM